MTPMRPLRRWVASWDRPGLRPEHERRFDLALVALVALFAIGWGAAVAVASAEGRSTLVGGGALTRSPLSPDSDPDAAFLLQAALDRFATAIDYRGESGALNIAIPEPGDTLLPDSLPSGVDVGYQAAGEAGVAESPSRPGIWNVVLRLRGETRRLPGVNIVTLIPFTEKRGGRIGRYVMGAWPYESGGTPRSPEYAPPRGFIRVTPENLDLQVSEHFRLGDFLTKGQEDVWPKYIVLSPRMLDKLELTIQQLEEMGHPVEDVGVISGFRHPSYNEAGGNPSGRGALSRHMYGDATDFFVDNDGDFCMDDLTGDGQATVADARVMAEAAEQVEKDYPRLIGGIGTYSPTGAHCGFIHVDTRGYRARW